jgi:hypothetical protein
MTDRELMQQPQRTHWEGCDEVHPECKQPEQELVAWRNAAMRVGEDLCSVGPFGYYDMTAQQWLDWALSVVTCHPPQRREWVGLTDEEIYKIDCLLITNITELVIAIETKLKEKNNV